MNTTHLHTDADYPKSSIRLRFAIAFFAVAVSSTVIGGVLELFDMQSGEAMIATASVPARSTAVVEASPDAIRSATANGLRRG